VTELRVLAVFVLAGCFGSHGRGDDPDPPPLGAMCNCCGVEVEAESEEACAFGVCDPYCLFPPPPTQTCDCCGTDVEIPESDSCDDGYCDGLCPPPPLSTCEPRPIDLLCYDHFRANTPQTLEVRLGSHDSCYCGKTVECTASVLEDGVLELSTSLCAGDLLCDGCFPFVEGTCEIPSLSEGRWEVRVNGEPAFDVGVLPEDVIPERAPTCSRRAETPLCEDTWPPTELAGGISTCHAAGAYAGQPLAIEVTDHCGGCGTVAGDCDVMLLDGTVVVRPSAIHETCVDCPAICEERTQICTTPPMPAGVWRVEVRGATGDTEVVVSDGDEPPPDSVVCTAL